MLKKLKSVLMNPRGSFLPLAIKAAVFTTFLLTAGYHWLLVAVFILATLYFYFRPSLNTSQFLSSFLVLLIASLFCINLPLITHYSLLITLFFGFLFFLLLGIKNLIFVNRQPLYHLFNALLFLTLFVFFFSTDKSQWFSVKYLMTFSGILLLSREFLSFSTPEVLGLQKKNLIAWGFAFLILQLLWATALLPISFINASSLALLIVLILQDFAIHYLNGTISRRVVLRNVTAFLILGLIIFGSSSWTP